MSLVCTAAEPKLPKIFVTPRRGSVGEAVKRPEKLVLIGLDAPITPRILDLARRGELPAIADLIRRGTVAANCMVPFPTITPPNWITIVTGAWPGTHQITCFNDYNPGDPLDVTVPAFDVRHVEAELIWNKAAEAGKKSIVLNYPTTWPPSLKSGYQIAGAGLSVNEWRFENPNNMPYCCTLADEQLFSTESYPHATTIALSEVAGPKGAKALEAELKLTYRRARYPIKEVTWHLRVEQTHGSGYDLARVSRDREGKSTIALLRLGQWSPFIVDTFETRNGPRKAVFALKLLDLSPDGKNFKLYVTPLCALDGWSQPQELANEIRSAQGLPVPVAGYEALNLEWIDPSTYLELVEMHNVWLADAACYLMTHKEWDLFFMHNHIPDYAYHSYATKIEPLTNRDEEKRRIFTEVELGFYKSLDRMISRIVATAGQNALFILVSDHGAKATGRAVPTYRILEEKGLLAFKETGESKSRTIDWAKTKAFPQRSCYVYVNLKGRDPDGVVDPGDYEKVRDEVISALYDYTDPETGKKPFTFVLRKEDARILGLYGRKVGDIVYSIGPEFGGQHGNHLPTAKFGMGSLEGLLVLTGPGVKKGHVLERNAWLTDIVPTICYLMNLPIPAQAEGAILYQALEDPDLALKEKEELERNLRRISQAYEADRQLTHTYAKPV